MNFINDAQWRAEAALSKSHILAKRVVLIAVIFLAFGLRMLGFVKMRGKFELEDIFNVGWNDGLSSGTGVINFFGGDDLCCHGIFPGLATIVATLQTLFNLFGVSLSLETIYTLVGPTFAAVTVYTTFLLGKTLKDDFTGILGAAMVSVIPGFFSVSADGRAGNVVIGTCAITLTAYFFLKSVKQGSMLFAVFAGISYAFLGSLWSGYIFMLYLASAYVVVMILLNKLDSNVYQTFTIFYIVGSGLCVLLPVYGFSGFLYLEQFPGIAVFVLLQIAKQVDASKLIAPIGGVFVIAFVASSVLGVLAPSDAFHSFLTQVTSGNGSNWVSFYRDLHLVLFLFPAGVVLCFRKRNNVNVFFIVYALAAVALSSFSSHFTPILCPVAACLASLSLTAVIRAYTKHQDAPVKKSAASQPVTKEIGFAVLAGVVAIIVLFFVYSFSAASHPAVYRPESSFPMVSKQTNEIAWMDDFREAHSWLRHNTAQDSKIVSWKGLSHKISAFARKSVLGDNLERPKHLNDVAKAFKSDETQASAILEKLGADYVVVTFGGFSGFRNDDLNHISEIAPDGQFDAVESVLYKLSYYGFADQFSRSTNQMGFDVVRRQPISVRPELSLFEEVFTSEHWVVRVYKVKPAPAVVETPEEDVEAEE